MVKLLAVPPYGNRQVVCPSILCEWRGTNHQLENHIKENHLDEVANNQRIKITLNKRSVDRRIIVEINEKYYIIRLKFKRGKRIFKMRIIDPDGIISSDAPRCFLTVQSIRPHIDTPVEIPFYYYNLIKTNEWKTAIDFKNIDKQTAYPISCEIFVNTKDNKIYCTITVCTEWNYISRKALECYKCPACQITLMKPPIHMCKRGHSLCELCYVKTSRQNKNCPICRSRYSSTRNYTVEDFLTQMFSECRNKDNGCTYYGLCQDLADHEEVCEKYKVN